MWPQYVYICLLIFGMGVVAAKHGEPKKNHNFWFTLLASGSEIFLLYKGGFFNNL